MMQRQSHRTQTPIHPKLFSLKDKVTTSIKCLGLNTKFEAKPKISRRFSFSGILAQPSLKWSLTLTFCHTFLQYPTCQTGHNQIREHHIYIYLTRREYKLSVPKFFFPTNFPPFFFFFVTNYDMSCVFIFFPF